MEIENLKNILGQRVSEPTVKKVYDSFVDFGCLDQCAHILKRMPNEVSAMVVGVEATQVNKEKAIWPVYLAQALNLDVNRVFYFAEQSS